MKTSSIGLLAFIALGGCASATVTSARSADKTPPANAESIGKMSSPKAGSQTIPIHDVDVYKFTANIDDDTDELYWAYDGEVVYVWGSIALATSVAALILEADDYGYGWIIATDAMTLCGCSAV